MSNPTSTRQQLSTNGSAISKQTSITSTVYSCEQQEKLLNLQGEVDLLLAQIQAETNILAAR
jgi:hypothetical protein